MAKRHWSNRLTAGIAGIAMAGCIALPVQAADEDAPQASEMVADMLVARPSGVVVTALGAVAFVATLPFTAAGGNMKEAAQHLVVKPAKNTFYRCLGCTSTGRYESPDK